MSNIHVLEKNGNSYRLAYHIAIPAANNGAGISYQTAIVNSGLSSPSVLKSGDGTAGTINATETSQIAAGSLVEVVANVAVSAGLTGGQIITLLQNDYTANSAVLLNDLQAKLIQYGRVI